MPGLHDFVVFFLMLSLCASCVVEKIKIFIQRAFFFDREHHERLFAKCCSHRTSQSYMKIVLLLGKMRTSNDMKYLLMWAE